MARARHVQTVVMSANHANCPHSIQCSEDGRTPMRRALLITGKEMACVVVFAWIGQILLFFICWKLFHWATVGIRVKAGVSGIVTELVVNVILSILLLIVLANVSSLWWLMGIVGAVVGVVTGQLGSRSNSGD